MKRNGLALITAIMLMVIISTVGVMILSIASTSSKKATDDYLHIQAEALSRSATEFAVMRVQGFDRGGGGCLEKLNIDASPFDINITINYLFKNKPSNCNFVYDNNVSDDDLNGTIILDVTVTERMPLDQTLWIKEPIRVHKRTIQKP
ncbi:MAG TPA: hypothetical protein PLV58_11290 [Campylobacterales bacterium]|nr:hypothetical protein [Campylobacterales bacterium]